MIFLQGEFSHVIQGQKVGDSDLHRPPRRNPLPLTSYQEEQQIPWIMVSFTSWMLMKPWLRMPPFWQIILGRWEPNSQQTHSSVSSSPLKCHSFPWLISAHLFFFLHLNYNSVCFILFFWVTTQVPYGR